MAELFNRIDLHNRQWEADNAGCKTTYATPKPPAKPVAPVVPQSQRVTSNPEWTGPAPMDLSAGARAAARTAKRAKAIAEGLCWTCASPDHRRANCAVQARYDQARALKAAATTTSTATTPEVTRGEEAEQPAGNGQPGN